MDDDAPAQPWPEPPPEDRSWVAGPRLAMLLMLASPADLDVMAAIGADLASDRDPDIAVVRSDQAGGDWVDRPPLLAVDVAPYSTRKDECAARGITSYWLLTADRDRPVLTAYRLHNGKYRELAVVVGEGTFSTYSPFPFSVVPALLVAGSPRWHAALADLIMPA